MRSLRKKTLHGALAITLVAATLVSGQYAAHAAVVTATGTDAAICNQTVSDATNVTAVRLAGGDCVITFTSGTVTWTPPANLKSIRALVVGGGGGGGGSYDTAGAGGGGAGQVIAIDNRKLLAKASYTITVGQGGAAGYHVARTNAVEAIGVAGTNSVFSINGENTYVAYAGGGGGSSRANAAGTSPRVGGAAATLTSGGVGGGPGGAWGSGGGGGGSSGTGGNGSTASPATAVPGGSGIAIDISGSNVTYGVGGAGGVEDGVSSAAGISASANSGSGGSGASVFGATYKNGGAGGSGVVIVRYSTAAPTFSNLAITGNPRTAFVRSSNTISATVSSAATITFFAGKTRISTCISVPTSGSGANNVATCTWKPTVKGPIVVSAEASPTAPGLSGTSTSNITVGVVARAGTR